MATLISKKGITGASSGSGIPLQWSNTWFQSFVNNLLKGADVRNAIAGPGITITGTISSPYATISAGGGGPGTITYTNNIIIAPTTGIPLIVESNGGTPTFEVTGSTTGITVEAYGPTAGGLVDLTPDIGSFTATLTGCSGTPTVTATWARVGNLVILNIPELVGTSTSTACTITGLPAEIQTATSQNIGAYIENNSAVAAGGVQVSAGSGTITLFSTNAFSATFTNGGTKGFFAGVLPYHL
jgi:hypothetical protein